MRRQRDLPLTAGAHIENSLTCLLIALVVAAACPVVTMYQDALDKPMRDWFR